MGHGSSRSFLERENSLHISEAYMEKRRISGMWYLMLGIRLPRVREPSERENDPPMERGKTITMAKRVFRNLRRIVLKAYIFIN